MTDNNSESQFNEFEARLLNAAQDMVRYAKGELTENDGIKVHTYPKIPDDVDVKNIREKLHMTQKQFSMFGFSESAIRHWEHNRRTPEGAARVLLKVIEHHPKVVLDTLNQPHA